MILSGATQGSDMKTLRNLLLLRYLQLDGTIHAICGSRYAAKSSPRFKRYNTHISMRVIMDSDGYHCMTIPTIKRRELGCYEKITTCKSCSNGDPKYLCHQLQSQQSSDVI